MQSQLIGAYKVATTDERKLLLVVVTLFGGFIFAVAMVLALADPASAGDVICSPAAVCETEIQQDVSKTIALPFWKPLAFALGAMSIITIVYLSGRTINRHNQGMEFERELRNHQS